MFDVYESFSIEKLQGAHYRYYEGSIVVNNGMQNWNSYNDKCRGKLQVRFISPRISWNRRDFCRVRNIFILCTLEISTSQIVIIKHMNNTKIKYQSRTKMCIIQMFTVNNW